MIPTLELTEQPQPQVETLAAVPLAPETAKSINILLVDDDPRNLDVLESILDVPEYRLVRAQSADEALRALVSQTFALLVLDVHMPEVNGLELARLIKQRKKTQHVPIIFLTAYYGQDDHVLQGYDIGGVDYVIKPCNPAILRSKVAVFAELFRANRALLDEVAERRQAEQRLAERTAKVQELVNELRALATQLTQAEQRERSRVAGTLHDHVQQFLVSAQMQLATFRRHPAPERLQTIVQDVESTLKQAFDATRSLAIELNPPLLQTAGLAAGLKWLAKQLAEKNQFEVEVRVDSRAEPNKDEERFLLFACARELLLNAIKHAGVSEAQLSLLRTDEDRVKVVVEDKGKGFDLEQFRNRKSNQLTFGLFSIQQRLVHLGGNMEIESMPGKGTRVTLTAPLAGVAAPAKETHAIERPSQPESNLRIRRSSPPIRVLIVDDHKIMRQGLAGLLRFEPDIEVVGEAEDGPQAIDLAAQLAPDVIVMDINLGTMNGIDATRAILSTNPNIKVVGLSMHAEPQMADAMRNAGAVAYVTKGGACEELLAAIRAIK
ncbi:MAG: response regulator [Candidatus Hydrogenedentes bacterium]|nr:response regulator [Candidatus Hydrogenedentota bacterium]